MPLASEVHALESLGVAPPLLVSRAESPDKFYILLGVGVWRAAQLVQCPTLPIVVFEDSDPDAQQALVGQAIQKRNPIHQAECLSEILETYPDLTRQDIQDSMHISRHTISHLLRLLKLPSSVKNLIRSSRLSGGHARALLRLNNRQADLVLLAEAVISRHLSVRQTEKVAALLTSKNITVHEAIGRILRSKASPPSARTNLPLPVNEGLQVGTLYDDPNVTALSEELSKKLGSQVKITKKKGSTGCLVIDYFDFDHLDGILNHIQ